MEQKFNLIKLEILKTTISKSETDKLVGMLGGNLSYEIEYLGKYPLLREFGMLPMVLDRDLILELTKAFMDKGMNHSDAYDAAFEIASQISKEGQRPTPFLRTAIDKIGFKLANENISKKHLDNMVASIADLAKKMYMEGNARLKVTVPLKYNIYIIDNGRKQKL